MGPGPDAGFAPGGLKCRKCQQAVYKISSEFLVCREIGIFACRYLQKGKIVNVIPSAAFARRSIFKSLGDLPPLPAVASKVIVEAESPDASPASMEAIIHSDPAIAAKALKVVNSAYYGLPGQVSSLTQACMLLGVQQIRNIVLGMCAMNALTAGQMNTAGITQFWLHSFATAHGSRLIGLQKKVRPVNLDLLFVAGLLHDLGKLFLFTKFSEFYAQVLEQWAENPGPIHVIEQELLGVTHDVIGGEITEIWGLPSALSELIAKHEGPFDASSPELCFPIHIGDELSKYLYEQDAYARAPLFDPVAEEWLGYSDAQKQELAAAIQAQVEQMKPVVSQLAA